MGLTLSQVATGMADGQIRQARQRLQDPWRRGRGVKPGSNNLIMALEHMRSACYWLIASV